jgi:hypothetical protein
VKEAARKKIQEIEKKQIELQQEQEQDTLGTVEIDTVDNNR